MSELRSRVGADAERMRLLRRYDVLEGEPDSAWSRLAEMASVLSSSSQAMVVFAGRDQPWVRAGAGDRPPSASAVRALIDRVMDGVGPLVVEDVDPGSADAPGLGLALAGWSLRSAEGRGLGALCVADAAPRRFEPRHLKGLELMVAEAQRLLAVRRAQREHVERLTVPALLVDERARVRVINRAALSLLGLASEPGQVLLIEILPARWADALAAAPDAAEIDVERGTQRFNVTRHPLEYGALLEFRARAPERRLGGRGQQKIDLLESLVNGSPDVIFSKDLQGRYTLINEPGARSLGHARSTVLGKTDHELLPSDEASLRVARDLAVIGAARTVAYEDTDAQSDRTSTWLVNEGVLRDRDGQVAGVFGIARDITDRKRVERELELGEERLRLALDAGHLGTWDWDVGTGQLELSGATLGILGMAPDERASAAELEAHVLPEDLARLRSAVQDVIAEARDLRVEFRIRRLDGAVRWIQASGRPQCGPQGWVVRLVGVAFDVTAERDRQAQASRVARFQEQLLGIVSHDLRNPLSAIRVWTANLSRDLASPREKRCCDRIIQSADRMDRMIAGLLDFTRARLGGGLDLAPVEVDLAEICAQVVDELGAAYPGRLRFTVRGDGHGTWDPGRLAQVVSNLVGNALQHSPAQSLVEVSMRGADAVVTLAVHNSGPPISKETLPLLFEPFRRGVEVSRRGNGLGLGLYITREAVEAHRGTIEAQSTARAGTTFRVRLPRRRGA